MFEEANACLLNCQPCVPEPGGPNPRALITLTSLLPLTTAQTLPLLGLARGARRANCCPFGARPCPQPLSFGGVRQVSKRQPDS